MARNVNEVPNQSQCLRHVDGRVSYPVFAFARTIEPCLPIPPRRSGCCDRKVEFHPPKQLFTQSGSDPSHYGAINSKHDISSTFMHYAVLFMTGNTGK